MVLFRKATIQLPQVAIYILVSTFMSLCSLHIECVWKRGIQDLDVLSVYQENAINDEFQSCCEAHWAYLA